MSITRWLKDHHIEYVYNRDGGQSISSYDDFGERLRCLMYSSDVESDDDEYGTESEDDSASEDEIDEETETCRWKLGSLRYIPSPTIHTVSDELRAIRRAMDENDNIQVSDDRDERREYMEDPYITPICSDEELAHVNYLVIDRFQSWPEYSLHVDLPAGTFDYVVDRLEDVEDLPLACCYSILVDLRHLLPKKNLSNTIYLNDGHVTHSVNCSLPSIREVVRLDSDPVIVYYLLSVGDERIALQLMEGAYHTNRGTQYGVVNVDHIEGVYTYLQYCDTNEIPYSYKSVDTYTAIRQDKRQLMCNEIAGMFNT